MGDAVAGRAQRSLTARGASTRRRILDSGETVFGRLGYHDASIADITGGAGVALGTFYIYFESKLELYRALIHERGREMRSAMKTASAAAGGRIAKERAGFAAFCSWMTRHSALYRVIRQAEFVDVELYDSWYRLLAEGYARGLREAAAVGEIAPVDDPETLAYCLMGVGDFVGMRWLKMEPAAAIPPSAYATMMAFVERGLTVPVATAPAP